MIQRVTISGFKSIEHMELDLKPRNVLIGANGAGKSNLLEFFEMLRWVGNGSFQTFVAKLGGADKILHWGAKRTQEIATTIVWEDSDGTPFEYKATWRYARGDTLFFESEELVRLAKQPWTGLELDLGDVVAARCEGSGHRETILCDAQAPQPAGRNAGLEMLGSFHRFHFHDTSPEAGVRQNQRISMVSEGLRRDASNLAAFLLRMRSEEGVYYSRVIATIRQVLPWFRDFVLQPLEENKEFIPLRWRGPDPHYVFGADQLSDGALRAIALITLLLQAEEGLPRTILIDEPELGLHPFAIVAVAGLAKAAAHSSQVIMATQSTRFLDEFDAEDVVVVDREGDHQDMRGRTTFQRAPEQMSPELLEEWLAEYDLSELWEKNVLGGGPV